MPRSRNFIQGGPGPTTRKHSGQRFCFVFYSPQLILQFSVGVQLFYYRENYTFPRTLRGPTFFRGGGGSNFFQGGGGPNANFCRNPYSVIFQGGLDPYPPLLDLHMMWVLYWDTLTDSVDPDEMP